MPYLPVEHHNELRGRLAKKLGHDFRVTNYRIEDGEETPPNYIVFLIEFSDKAQYVCEAFDLDVSQWTDYHHKEWVANAQDKIHRVLGLPVGPAPVARRGKHPPV